MNRIFPTFLFLTIFTISAIAQHNLTISFTNIKTAKGQLMVMLGDENGEDIEGFIVQVAKTGTVPYTIPDLKSGKYTVKVYHDIDKNEDLNTGTFGIPKEPYGFSNDARGTFGPPDVEDQLFAVNKDTAIRIKLN